MNTPKTTRSRRMRFYTCECGKGDVGVNLSLVRGTMKWPICGFCKKEMNLITNRKKHLKNIL